MKGAQIWVLIGLSWFLLPSAVSAEIRVESFYGIQYDLTELPADFETSALIRAIAKLNEFLADNHIVINGVRVTALPPFDARIYRTKEKYLSGGRHESEKYILEISHELAYSPEKIRASLEGNVIKTQGQANRKKVEQARRDMLTQTFDDVKIPGQVNPEEGRMDKVGKAGMNLVKKVGHTVVGKERLNDINEGVQENENAFSEFFSSERPGAILSKKFDFSVSGIDINEDGIRDDVYYYIRSEYRRDVPTQEALKQIARIFQSILLKADDKAVSIDLARELGYAMECLASVRPADSQVVGEALIDVVLDTEVRGQAYLKHFSHIEGIQFPPSPQEEWPSRCADKSHIASVTSE